MIKRPRPLMSLAVMVVPEGSEPTATLAAGAGCPGGDEQLPGGVHTGAERRSAAGPQR